MDLLRFVSVIWPALVWFPSAVSSPMCKITEYYDSVTRNCAYCSDICLNAKLQQTEGACEQNCRGWPFPPETPMGEQAVGEKDHKGVTIGTVITGFVLAIVTLFVTVKYRQKITTRVRRLCRPNERINEGGIEMQPMGREHAGNIENRPDGGIENQPDGGTQEEGRRQHGHQDNLEPAIKVQEKCPDDVRDDASSAIGASNFNSCGGKSNNDDNTSGGDANTRNLGNTRRGDGANDVGCGFHLHHQNTHTTADGDDDEIEERQALLSSENTGRKEVSPESGVQAVQDAVNANPVFSPSVQGSKRLPKPAPHNF